MSPTLDDLQRSVERKGSFVQSQVGLINSGKKGSTLDLTPPEDASLAPPTHPPPPLGASPSMLDKLAGKGEAGDRDDDDNNNNVYNGSDGRDHGDTLDSNMMDDEMDGIDDLVWDVDEPDDAMASNPSTVDPDHDAPLPLPSADQAAAEAVDDDEPAEAAEALTVTMLAEEGRGTDAEAVPAEAAQQYKETSHLRQESAFSLKHLPKVVETPLKETSVVLSKVVAEETGFVEEEKAVEAKQDTVMADGVPQVEEVPCAQAGESMSLELAGPEAEPDEGPTGKELQEEETESEPDEEPVAPVFRGGTLGLLEAALDLASPIKRPEGKKTGVVELIEPKEISPVPRPALPFVENAGVTTEPAPAAADATQVAESAAAAATAAPSPALPVPLPMETAPPASPPPPEDSLAKRNDISHRLSESKMRSPSLTPEVADPIKDRSGNGVGADAMAQFHAAVRSVAAAAASLKAACGAATNEAGRLRHAYAEGQRHVRLTRQTVVRESARLAARLRGSSTSSSAQLTAMNDTLVAQQNALVEEKQRAERLLTSALDARTLAAAMGVRDVTSATNALIECVGKAEARMARCAFLEMRRKRFDAASGNGSRRQGGDEEASPMLKPAESSDAAELKQLRAEVVRLRHTLEATGSAAAPSHPRPSAERRITLSKARKHLLRPYESYRQESADAEVIRQLRRQNLQLQAQVMARGDAQDRRAGNQENTELTKIEAQLQEVLSREQSQVRGGRHELRVVFLFLQ